MEKELVVIAIVIFIFVVVFLIVRDLICWYYKINQRIINQEKIIKLLEQIKNGKNS